MSAPYYQDDTVTLYLGDCRDILPEIEGGVSVLVTDPPYGIAWTRARNAARKSRAHPGILNDEDTTHRDEALAVFLPRPAVVFGSLYAPFPAAVRQVLIWQKPNDAGVVGSTTGYRRDVEAVFLCGDWPLINARKSSVLRCTTVPNIGSPSSPAGRTGHPHAKPVDLMAALLEACPPGVVCDPFTGSGSTLVAAKLLGRRAVGIELDEQYAEVAARRLAQDVLNFGAGE